jgi:hypothetical protein
MASKVKAIMTQHQIQNLTRRSLLSRSVYGIGAAALASLLNRPTASLASPSGSSPLFPGIISPRHFAPKAKRVIHLCMAGGPSHLETFDHKPKLAEMTGQPMPESFTKGQPIAQLQGAAQLKCLGPQWAFKKFGKSGQEISEVFPHIGTIADEICIVRSMVTEAINHDPAHTFMNTGTTISGRPSMGSWVWYGLGAECDNLPGFVVLTSTGKAGQQQPIPRGNGPAVSSPASSPASASIPRATPSTTSIPPQASRATASATSSTPRRSSTASTMTSPPTPRLPPASHSTRWPSRCRLASPA